MMEWNGMEQWNDLVQGVAWPSMVLCPIGPRAWEVLAGVLLSADSTPQKP